MDRIIKIGIIGAGSIGREIAVSVEKLGLNARVAAIADLDLKKARDTAKLLQNKPEVVNIENLIKISDLVVESANASILSKVLKLCVKYKKNLLVMSVGGLLRHKNLLQLAAKKGVQIYVPSGAVAGLDAVRAGAVSGVRKAVLTTRKPPAGLKGAPYLIKNNISLEKIKKAKTVFFGSVSRAVKGFPANINVSAALAFAAGGAEKVKVKIIADPGVKSNIHEIEAEGKFGKIKTVTQNKPFPNNPKTSYLAALSAVALIKRLAQKGLTAGS